jgi:hypothetical protein
MKGSFFKQANNAAFNNFDPGLNTFDPDIAARYNGADGDGNGAGSAVVAAKIGQKMQVNVTLTNGAAVPLWFELFNYLESFTRKRNTTYIPQADAAAYAYIPGTSWEGIARIAAGTGGVVVFDQNGDLMIRGDDSMVDDPIGRISCSESSYAGFFEASGVTPFQVAYIRETVTTTAQINKPLIWFRKSFSGGEEVNRISPRAYFRPNQFQDETIDLTVSFTVGIDSGLRMELLANETVELSFFIQMWTNQSIGQ